MPPLSSSIVVQPIGACTSIARRIVERSFARCRKPGSRALESSSGGLTWVPLVHPDGWVRYHARVIAAVAGAKAVPSEEVFRRVLVYASAPLKGAAAMHYADMLADCFSGEVVDARYEPLEPALERSAATLLAVSMPVVRSGAWLSNIGEPIVRFGERPIVFVPEFVDR